MRPDLHAVFRRQLERGMGRRRVSRVEAAANVGGRDERHQLRVEPAAFAQVAV